MGLEDLKIFKMLLPKGSLWNYGQKLNIFLECISNQIEYLRKYQNDIIKESSPFTSEDTIFDWISTYNLVSSNDVLTDKKLVRLYALSFGGQNIEYFKRTIQKEYPSIEIKLLDDKTTIVVLGEILSKVEYNMFVDYTEKIFPAYCLISYNVQVLENFGQYCECGVAECGVAISGYQEIKNKDGEVNEIK